MSRDKKVVVGMSGGVDSSVAACLLYEQGYYVIGVTMQIWQDECRAVKDATGGCCGFSGAADARRAAAAIGIPHFVVDFRDVFRESVIEPFVSAYKSGNTPNPCILCNTYVKWQAMLEYALSIGADHIATGHYARIGRLENGRYAVRRSVTAQKDQTYALYGIGQEELAHTLMPIGDYTKDQVRQIARERGLPVADKPDSQEICFVPDNDHARFIEEYTGEKALPGDLVDRDQRVLGRHKGIINYTIGQRKGLGISAGHPVFVTEIRPETNEVVIGESEELFGRTVYCNDVVMMGLPRFEDGMSLTGKIRYSHKGAPCRVYDCGGVLRCEFEEPVRAATPGQALVLYCGEYVAGGGTIIRKPAAP